MRTHNPVDECNRDLSLVEERRTRREQRFACVSTVSVVIDRHRVAGQSDDVQLLLHC